MPTYSPYVQERWELVEYVNSTVLDDVAQPVWRESSAAGGLADVYGLSRLSTSGGNDGLAIADTYLEDGLGSVSAVLREGGAVAASLSYSPWGEEELAMESLPGYGDRFERPHYGYNAEQSSPEGGLQYLRARWYDPSMGAFGSRDSLLGDAADPATLNRYAYAEGNPVASCDPTGHESRVKYGGANANRIRRLASNPRRGAGASTGTWMSRNYTQKALSSKKPGLLTTRRVSNPVLASGGKRRAAVQSSAKSVVSTGVGKMQAWVAGQTTGRSLTSRLAATRGGTRAAAKRSALYGQARRDRDRQMELFCTTAEYFGAPGKKNFDSDPHTTLDVMGMASGQLEPVGVAADLLNGVLYLVEGDFANAGISWTGAIPIVGTTATGARLSKKAYDALDIADEAEAVARATKKANVTTYGGEATDVVGNRRLQLNQSSNGLESVTRNQEAVINNRLYSGHAIDRMQDRGIMPSVVEEAIIHGKSRPDPNHADRVQYYDKKNGIQIVTSLEGKIITVEYNSRGW